MSTTIKALRADVQRCKESAQAILERVEREQRPLTADERRVIEELTSRAQKAKADAEQHEALGRKVADLSGGSAPAGGSMFDAFKAKGFPGQRAEIPATYLKTVTVAAGSSDDDLARSRVQGAPLGFDTRFADVFPSSPLASGATSVEILKQSSRTLAAPAAVQRDPMATTAKAETSSEVSLEQVAVEQLATISSGIPEHLLRQPAIAPIVQGDLRLAILEARDDAVLSAITAAGPANGPGGADLITQILAAQNDMVTEDGYVGSTVVLSPGDFQAFQLLRGDAEQFARRDPAEGFGFVVAKGIADGGGMLVDPANAGKVFQGPLALENFVDDPKANTRLLRLEQLFLAHIERVGAIRLLAAAI